MAQFNIHNGLSQTLKIKVTFFYLDYSNKGDMTKYQTGFIHLDPHDQNTMQINFSSTYMNQINIYVIDGIRNYRYKFCGKNISQQHLNYITIREEEGSANPLLLFNGEIPIRTDKLNSYSCRWYICCGNADNALDDISQEERDGLNCECVIL